MICLLALNCHQTEAGGGQLREFVEKLPSPKQRGNQQQFFMNSHYKTFFIKYEIQ
jgi:hypothetical protein